MKKKNGVKNIQTTGYNGVHTVVNIVSVKSMMRMLFDTRLKLGLDNVIQYNPQAMH